MIDAQTLRAAVALFQEYFLAEPLCSDEALPLLLLALPEDSARSDSMWQARAPQLLALPLFRDAIRGLARFERGLRAAGVAEECITYAPWPGCQAGLAGGKRTKSPVLGGGLAQEERDELMRDLARRGVLFGRKLGLGGGSTAGHLELIGRSAPAPGEPAPRAPARLLPEEAAAGGLHALAVQFKWCLTLLEAHFTVSQHIVIFAVMAALSGWLALYTGCISRGALRTLLGVYVGGHLVVFFISVAAFEEYSLLAPLQRAPAKPEL